MSTTETRKEWARRMHCAHADYEDVAWALEAENKALREKCIAIIGYVVDFLREVSPEHAAKLEAAIREAREALKP